MASPLRGRRVAWSVWDTVLVVLLVGWVVAYVWVMDLLRVSPP